MKIPEDCVATPKVQVLTYLEGRCQWKDYCENKDCPYRRFFDNAWPNLIKEKELIAQQMEPPSGVIFNMRYIYDENKSK